jgi:tetratricopeptide (TPR) repeat protein
MEEMNAAAYLKSGIEYFEKGDYDRAIADTSEAIRLNPNDALAYGTRGAAYKAKKDFDHAIADLTEAIRLDPNNAPAYGNRGLAYLAKKDRNQAISDLEMAAKIQPENDGIRRALKQIKAGRSSNISGITTKETIRKEIKIILIGAGIGAVIGVIFCLLAMNDPIYSVGFKVFFGIWAGLGVGGNIIFVLQLFLAGWFVLSFGFGWIPDRSESFISNLVTNLLANTFGLLLKIFLAFLFAWAGFVAFVVAGPIWPLIRLLMKRSKLKKMEA